MIDAALACIARGWATMPLAPRSKAPAGWLVPHGWKDATTDPAQARKWWGRTPTLGMGVPCEPSGLLVIDWDPRNGPDDLHDLEQRLGPLPLTVEVLTGGGGRHLYFQLPAFETRGELAPGVELKRRGYVVAPPTIHPDTGRAYEWAEHPDETPIAELPADWLAAATSPPRRPAVAAPRTLGDALARPDDPLKRIPAALYVERLTGQAPDRGGFITCPFHSGGQERTPSLRVFDDGGWFCFGCNQGGGIYQLAALIGGYPLPLRGADFLSVQETLLNHFTAYYEQRNAAA